MRQVIADKLNFLMKVTETKNNMLSRALSFDASHISRIRSGQRGLPSRREFIIPAAAYFAQAVHTATQRNLLAKRICKGKKWPDTPEAATLLIAEWLSDNGRIDYIPLNHYLENNNTASPTEAEAATASSVTSQFFLNNEGKRQCVLRFLTELVASEEPVTLLLHSEENMEWMYEKPEFAKQWGLLLTTLLQHGSRIIIIHTITRSFEEMVEAVAKWSPLYATGFIEPYYYPHLRDKVFRRTLFIASGVSAIVSCTTGEAGVNRLNMLIRDPVAVLALEQEFNDFLSMCRPLMQIFTQENFQKLIPVLTTFRKGGSELLQYHITPSLITLPDAVAESFSRRPGCEIFSEFLADHKRWLFMRGKSPANPVTDILYLPDLSVVTEGKVPVPLSNLIGLPTIYYTAEEYLLHLENALACMEHSDTYQIIALEQDTVHPVTGRSAAPPYSIVASREAGVMLFSAQTTAALFYTREQIMVSSFREYLEGFIKNAAPREETLTRLRQYIAELKKKIE